MPRGAGRATGGMRGGLRVYRRALAVSTVVPVPTLGARVAEVRGAGDAPRVMLRAVGARRRRGDERATASSLAAAYASCAGAPVSNRPPFPICLPTISALIVAMSTPQARNLHRAGA